MWTGSLRREIAILGRAEAADCSNHFPLPEPFHDAEPTFGAGGPSTSTNHNKDSHADITSTLRNLSDRRNAA